jgi:hypothetical protein
VGGSTKLCEVVSTGYHGTVGLLRNIGVERQLLEATILEYQHRITRHATKLRHRVLDTSDDTSNVGSLWPKASLKQACPRRHYSFNHRVSTALVFRNAQLIMAAAQMPARIANDAWRSTVLMYVFGESRWPDLRTPATWQGHKASCTNLMFAIHPHLHIQGKYCN